MEPSQQQSTFSLPYNSSSSFRSTVMDTIGGAAIWPDLYDGRAIVNYSFKDYLSGMSDEENIAQYKKSAEAGDTSRKVIWA